MISLPCISSLGTTYSTRNGLSGGANPIMHLCRSQQTEVVFHLWLAPSSNQQMERHHQLLLSHSFPLHFSSLSALCLVFSCLRGTLHLQPFITRGASGSRMLRILSVVVSCACALLARGDDSHRQCWYPDSTTKAPDYPCNGNADQSACCNIDAFCMENGLCLQNGVVSRGSCTDPSWSHEACAHQCVDGKTRFLALVRIQTKIRSQQCPSQPFRRRPPRTMPHPLRDLDLLGQQHQLHHRHRHLPHGFRLRHRLARLPGRRA